MTKDEKEVVEEVEFEETEEQIPRKNKVTVDIDLDDELYNEALRDVLSINEEIPKEPDVKSPELKELIAFKEECEALMTLIKPYSKDRNFDILSDEFSLKKAMEMAKEMIGINSSEEIIEGEPSPYVQELFKKLWQKYIDCKWFEAMMKGKRPITTKDLKFQKAPEDLLKIEGEKI